MHFDFNLNSDLYTWLVMTGHIVLLAGRLDLFMKVFGMKVHFEASVLSAITGAHSGKAQLGLSTCTFLQSCVNLPEMYSVLICIRLS